jgi:hypothetical protein
MGMDFVVVAVHHFNNRDPANAPAIEQIKMAPPYQTAMKDTGSSAQCSA